MGILRDGMGQALTAMEWDGMGQKNMSHGQAWEDQHKHNPLQDFFSEIFILS